jgi:hypothetical protein
MTRNTKDPEAHKLARALAGKKGLYAVPGSGLCCELLIRALYTGRLMGDPIRVLGVGLVVAGRIGVLAKFPPATSACTASAAQTASRL